MDRQLIKIFKKTKKTPQLVHNITNYVTVNDCANVLLAMGSSPIMADDIKEVEEITSICNALVINIGTLNSRTIQSMIVAGKRSNELGHPVILDPVGAGASNLRTQTVKDLLKEVHFNLIRGNASEIKTIAQGQGSTKGVDVDKKDQISEENLDDNIKMAQKLSENLGAVIVMTGAKDIVANSSEAYIIGNGHALMSSVSGTGCMLSSTLGAYLAANKEDPLLAAVCGVMAMGIVGEKAVKKVIKKNLGTASMRIKLIDALSLLKGKDIKACGKVRKWKTNTI